jgi:heme-degrading monooxygenase HmoA
MYSATFTFAKGEYDEEFHLRDQAIAEVARSIPGYLGEETWENAAAGLVLTVYYWQTAEALQQLIDHPLHLAAKQLQGRWLRGYQVTIAQVLRSYGDGGIAHPLASAPIGQPSTQPNAQPGAQANGPLHATPETTQT